MKNITAFILLFFVLSSLVLSQENQQTESQKLSQQIAFLYQKGNLDDAIPLAEKAVEIERKSSNKNYEKLASAITNLAVLR